jgi:16S rRNA (cytosine967-C5)-methyltransferase
MRSHSYLNSAKRIIELYDGAIPLAAWLKDYFRTNKKFGSKDRREVSHVCYCYLRLGKAFIEMEREEKMLVGLFLCSEGPNLVLQELKPEWNEMVSLSLMQKLQMIHVEEQAKEIFPFSGSVSRQINIDDFSISHLTQPSLFLRIRPGSKEKVAGALNAAALNYGLEDNCIRLPNGTKVEDIIAIDKDVVVQDLNSQKVLINSKSQISNLKFSPGTVVQPAGASLSCCMINFRQCISPFPM